MAAPSKFTAEKRTKILEAKQLGASDRTAADHAGIGHQTLARWLEKGRGAAEGTTWKKFHDDYLSAVSHPRMRALSIIYNEMPVRPDLAWKYIQRQEPGFEPPAPVMPSRQQGPIVIELALATGTPLALKAADIVEGEIVAESETGADTAAEAPDPAPAASR